MLREELPTSGEITVNGRDVVRMRSNEVPYLRRELGVIFQDYRLLPDKTIFENVAFAMQVIEAPRKIMQRSVNSVLDIVGLREKYKNFPDELSGGEQQRVAIARGIVLNHNVLLLDESLCSLDLKLKREGERIFKFKIQKIFLVFLTLTFFILFLIVFILYLKKLYGYRFTNRFLGDDESILV